MDIIITTASRSRYLIADTAVYRMSDHPIDGLPGGLPMGRTLLTWTSPTVGLPWRFTTVDGPIITSPVTDLRVAPFLAPVVDRAWVDPATIDPADVEPACGLRGCLAC